MVLVVLQTSPYQSSIYIQGIESALNLADAEADVINVLIDGEYLESIHENTLNKEFVKRLGQLSIYEIPVYSSKPICLESVVSINKRELFEKANKVVVF